jgi:signal transduction histidine kinase
MARKWVVGAAAVGVTLLLAFGVAAPIELPVRDGVLRLLRPKPAVATVIVVVDEASIRAVGPWPWSRTQLAALVDRIVDGGARAVLVDILLTDPHSDDDRLARALRRIPSAAVAVLGEHGEWLMPSPPLLTASIPAHGNFERDHDGVMRRFAATKQSRDHALTALPVEAASLASGEPVPVGVVIAPLFRTRPRDVPQIAAATLLNGGDAAMLKGKLVFLGPTAFGLGDRVITPVTGGRSADPGVTVHAAATESLLRHETIHEMPPIASGMVAAAAVAFVLFARRLRITALVLLAATFGGGIPLLAFTGVAVPFVTFTACIAVTFGVLEARTLLDALRRSEGVAAGLRRDREVEADSKRVLAHELKTPLASMRGLTQLLTQFELSDAERKRVTTLLESEAGKLQSLVGGLLDLERLPLRDFEASASVISLGDVVAARLEFLRASADRPLVMSENSAVFIRGDAALIERVVDNLVGNALKYAPPPAPVRVSVRSENGCGVLEVEDRGPGLSPEDRERVFQRFFRGRTAGGTQGLGLGLSLVAEVARWHGGTAGVEAAGEGGSLFRFSVPKVEAR